MEKKENNIAEEIIAPLKEITSMMKLLKLIEKAKKEYDENNFEGCKEICQKTLKEFPNNPVALRGMGCVMQAEGKNDKAVEYYEKALNFSMNKEIEYTLLGTVYYLEKDFEKAIEYFNLAIENNDDYEPAYEGKNQSMLEKHLEIADLQDSLIKQFQK